MSEELDHQRFLAEAEHKSNLDALHRRHREEVTELQTKHTRELEGLAASLASERAGLSAQGATNLLSEEATRMLTKEREAAERELQDLK